MCFRKSVSIQHQPYQHLFAIRTLVTGIAPFGLRVCLGLALEVGGRQVVEVNHIIQVEQRLLSFRQLSLNLLSLRIQLVQIAVKRILVEFRKICPQNISHGCPANPIRHGKFGKRENEPVQCHHFAQQTSMLRQPGTTQNLLQAQLLPYLMSHVHWPGLTVLLGFDPIGINGKDLPGNPFGFLQPLPTFTCPLDQGFCFCPLALQCKLSLQGRLHPTGQCKPLFTRSGLQAAKRTNRSLARSFGGRYRLDQKVVCVNLAFVTPLGFPDIHLPLT